MKLFSLRLTTLKSKLYAIVLASFFVRVVAFFMLPSSGSSLTPDEGAYAETSRRLASGELNSTLFSDNLLVQSRSFLYPSALIIKLGIDPLDAVRIVSTVYGLLALFYLIKILMILFDGRLAKNLDIPARTKPLILIVLIYAFLPSHFFWSIVGLRESAVEFWVVFISFQFQKMLVSQGASRRLPLILVGLSIPLLFSSRPQIGWVLSTSLIIYCVLNSFRKSGLRIVIPFILFGVVVGYIFSSPISVEKRLSYSFENLDSKQISTELRDKFQKCDKEGEIIELAGVKIVCKQTPDKGTSIKIKNSTNPTMVHTGAIEQHHKLNQQGAASVITTIACPFNPGPKISNYGCLVWRAPYTTFTFLFRPLLGPDVTSVSSLFASIENILWMAAFAFIIFMLTRNRKLAFLEVLVPPILFMCLYSVAAGAYEGNMGTAFRHKSLILWVVILLLASTIAATQQRKAEQQGISGSSQE